MKAIQARRGVGPGALLVVPGQGMVIAPSAGSASGNAYGPGVV